MRVGYAPLFRSFWAEELHDRRTLSAVMQPQAFDLPAIAVSGNRIVLSYGRIREFWLRRKHGFGRFFTREDIERRHPIRVSDMLFTIPGFSVYRIGGTTRIRSRRSGCAPRVWLDGVPLFGDEDVDAVVTPNDVEGIEVYSGAAGTPVEFSGGRGSCGAIVIWTR